MFKVWLQNWLDENKVSHADAALVMQIPFTENYKPCMINPTIKEEMGKAPSLDFTVNPGMLYYNAYQQLKTLIRVDYINTDIEPEESKTIFFGRVVTINTSNLLQIKSIHAEGLYAVFADTVQEGIEEDFQTKKTATQLWQEIIAAHNSQVGAEWWKVINIGNCNVQLDSEQKKRDSSSWQTTQAALDQLINNYGGYMRVRLDNAHGGFYLDWYRKYYRDLGPGVRPCFELAKNILDLSSSDKIGEIFTRVIPIGHKSSSGTSSTGDAEVGASTSRREKTMIYLSPKVINVENVPVDAAELTANFQSAEEFANAYNYYGNIYKTVNFPNAWNAELLAQYAYDWIKKNYYGALRSFSVKAVDMKMIGATDNTNDMILAGDCVDIVYPVFDQNGNRTLTSKRRLVCKSAQIVLYNPDQNTYTIGVPNDSIDFEYGQKKKTGRASTTAAAASAERPSSPPRKYNLDANQITQFLFWFYYSNSWNTKTDAQSHGAYSWRCDGMLTWTDQVPYKSYQQMGGVPKKVWTEQEEVEVTEYDPAYPGDKNHITGSHTEIQNVEKTDFYYLNAQGYSGKQVAFMGRYRTSPFNIWAITPPASHNPAKGFVYGIGWVVGTDTVFAFDVSHYRSGDTVVPLFVYPNFFGSHPDGENAKANASGSPDSIGTGGGGGTTDENGVVSYLDPQTGLPNAQIFPDSGRSSFGSAIEYVDANDNVVQPDEHGNYPEGSRPRQKTDANGNPIWYTTINTPITYQDTNGDTQTRVGCIVTNDIQLPEVPSFKTKIAIIDDLIAHRATIAQLRAFEAVLGDSTQAAYDSNGNFIGYQGTQMEVNGENFVSVTGIFEKDANGHIARTDHGANASPRYTYNIVDGAAIQMYDKDHMAVGLWNKGELAAGMFVEESENSGTYVGVKGDTVVVSSTGNLTAEDLADWAKSPNEFRKNGEAVFFSKFIVAKRIQVGEIAPTDDSLQILGNISVGGGAGVFGTYGNNRQYYTYINRGSITTDYINANDSVATTFGVADNGQIVFNSGNDSQSIQYSDAQGLIDTLSHVEVVQNNSTGNCELWYLPSNIARTGTNANPGANNDWILSSTFRKAATVSFSDSWSGGEGTEHVYTITESNSGTTRTVVFDSNDSGDIHINTGIDDQTITGGLNALGYPAINIPITLTSIDNNDVSTRRYTKAPISVSVSNLLDNRILTSNTTYGFGQLSSGKIGYGPITVEVPQKVTFRRTNDNVYVTAGGTGHDEYRLVTTGFNSSDLNTTTGRRTITVNLVPIDNNADGNPEQYFSIEIADYNLGHTQGMTDGKNAIKLNPSWSTANNQCTLTVSKSETAGQTQLTFDVAAAASLVYSSTTHKYTAGAQAKIDNTLRGYIDTLTENTAQGYLDGVAEGKALAKVKLDTNYNNNGSTIKAVTPVTDGTGSDFLRVWYQLNSYTGSGTNKKRSIDVLVGSTTIESIELTDYGDGYAAGQASAPSGTADTYVVSGNPTFSGTTVTQRIIVYSGTDPDEQVNIGALDVDVGLSSLLETRSVTLPADLDARTTTVYPSSGKLGMTRVTVNANNIYTLGRRNATVTGSWSGTGHFEVHNTSNTTQQYYTDLLAPTASDITWSGATASIALNASVNGSESATYTGKTISIDVSGKLDAKPISANNVTYYAADENLLGYSSVTVNISDITALAKVKLDTNYNNNGSTINAVVPVTDGTGNDFLRVWSQLNSYTGSGTSKKRSIDVFVGSISIEHVELTDYGVGYGEGRTDGQSLATVSGGWNDGTFEVHNTSNASHNKYTTLLYPRTSDVTWASTVATIKLYASVDGSETYTYTGRDISLDISGKLNNEGTIVLTRNEKTKIIQPSGNYLGMTQVTVDANNVYNKGWTDSYDEIVVLPDEDVVINPGESQQIFVKAKSSPTGNLINVSSFTISAASAWLYPGGSGNQGVLWPQAYCIRYGGASGTVAGSWWIPQPLLYDASTGSLIGVGAELSYGQRIQTGCQNGDGSSVYYTPNAIWTAPPDNFQNGYTQGLADRTNVHPTSYGFYCTNISDRPTTSSGHYTYTFTLQAIGNSAYSKNNTHYFYR